MSKDTVNISFSKFLDFIINNFYYEFFNLIIL